MKTDRDTQAEPKFSARSYLGMRMRVPKISGEALLLIGVFIFSFFLMFHTFSYDTSRHEMQIATKLWSDFGAHIPLVRSFSYGPNLTRLIHGNPVESPLFPHEPIRYHFGFYTLAGVLEKLGVRIDWAINIPSALGFFALMICIYLFSYTLFANRYVSLLSVLFFLFNGSLSFITFFKTHPFGPTTIIDILTNSRFPSFGPWDGGSISAFWNLNIYTNQRHLGLSYTLLLTILLTARLPMKKFWKTGVLIGSLVSMLLVVNFAAAGMAVLFIAWIFCIDKKSRPALFIAAGLSLFSFAWLRSVSHISSAIAWQPGYLMKDALSFSTFSQYWSANLGLHILLIPIGILLSPKAIRRLLVIPLLLLFILPNLFRFSTDMINNHKFFNFFLIIGNMFSAYALIRIFAIRNTGKLMGIIGLVALMLSGIIDFFPVINDQKGSIADMQTSADAQFYIKNTKPTDTIANSTWFYHPASTAGRAIYSGYTYFTWSYGYDQTKRETNLIAVYEAPTKQVACAILTRESIAFVELSQKPEPYLKPNWLLWNTFPAVYENPDTHLKIYSTASICSDAPTRP